MRMKEDAMLNGQLKPAYILQHGVDSEYVTWLDVFPAPTDTITLIPFLKDMEVHLTFKYKENYIFIESNEQTAYIKPQNYELSKTRKFRNDIIKYTILGNRKDIRSSNPPFMVRKRGLAQMI